MNNIFAGYGKMKKIGGMFANVKKENKFETPTKYFSKKLGKVKPKKPQKKINLKRRKSLVDS